MARSAAVTMEETRAGVGVRPVCVHFAGANLAAFLHQARPPSPSISALLALFLANTPAPPSISLALRTDSLQDRSSSWFWPSRAGQRACPFTLRSASARRRRRGVSPARGPRLVAPLLGPRGPGSDPRLPLLDHRGGGRPRSAPQARGDAAGVLPGSRPVPHCSACRVPWGPARIPGLPPLTRTSFIE